LLRDIIGLQISAYVILTIGMMFISFLGHGLATNRRQIIFQNYSVFISTIISGIIIYFNNDYFYEVIFFHVSVNIIFRIYTLEKI
jgi:hypothetical protein